VLKAMKAASVKRCAAPNKRTVDTW
jgi:hypothetical protein